MSHALVIAAHGSHYNRHTADPAWAVVDEIRRRGAFAEVTAAFWKEQPAFGTALSMLAADTVTVVPLFSSEGYFSQRVIPAELNPRPNQTVTITDAVGQSNAIAQKVAAATDEALHTLAAPAEETAVVVVGHGTTRNKQSEGTTEAMAARLRDQNRFGAVVTAFLDQEPLVDDTYARVSQNHLIVVPYFVAAGLHAAEDIPEALAIAPQYGTRQQSHGREIVYTRPFGIGPGLADVVLALAGWDGVPAAAGSVWAGFPQAADLTAALAADDVGQLWLGHAEYICHTADRDVNPADLQVPDTPAAVRAAVRSDENGHYRPWATTTDLPTGWRIPTPTAERRRTAVLTIYPRLGHADEVRSLSAVAARQQGRYRSTADVEPETRTAVAEAVCGACVLHPTWLDGRMPTETHICPEPCVLWLEEARNAEKPS